MTPPFPSGVGPDKTATVQGVSGSARCIVQHMAWTTEYIANVLGRLRFLPEWRSIPTHPTEGEDPQTFEEFLNDSRESVDDKARAYSEDLVTRYADRMEVFHERLQSLVDDAATLGEPDPPLPDPPRLLEDEIERVASLRHDLDVYLRSLVVLATSGLALDDYTQSDLARLTGSTRATISRWTTDTDTTGQVHQIVQEEASSLFSHLDQTQPVTDRKTAMSMGLLRWYAQGKGTSDG